MKLTGEFFHVDRWIASSAFALSIEVRGLYREMLSRAWLAGARLPKDHEAIQRLIGASPAEWRRCWPLVAPYWHVEGDYLVNDTQVEIYTASLARASRARHGGQSKGAQLKLLRQS